jgi:hypothetical protein
LESEPVAAAFALLAGDDEWSQSFTGEALAALRTRPDIGAIFPTFVWTGEDEDDRVLEPLSFLQATARARRRRALLLPDRRELANLVYGVYRPDAFRDLMAAWERGGDGFGSDFAAAWSLLGAHKVLAWPAAVGRRHVRPGADLIERAWIRRGESHGLLPMALLYVRLNVRVNRLLAAALARVAVDGGAPRGWQVQLTRAPQWLAASLHHVVRRRAQSRAVVGGGRKAWPDAGHGAQSDSDSDQRGDGGTHQRVDRQG